MILGRDHRPHFLQVSPDFVSAESCQPRRFIDQSGTNVESVFGGQFKDDKDGLQLQHNRKGLLSMANMVRAAAPHP